METVRSISPYKPPTQCESQPPEVSPGHTGLGSLVFSVVLHQNRDFYIRIGHSFHSRCVPCQSGGPPSFLGEHAAGSRAWGRKSSFVNAFTKLLFSGRAEEGGRSVASLLPLLAAGMAMVEDAPPASSLRRCVRGQALARILLCPAHAHHSCAGHRPPERPAADFASLAIRRLARPRALPLWPSHII